MAGQGRARLLLLLVASSTLFFHAGAETAPSDATCKGGAVLYREPASSIVGCYQFFPSVRTWQQANTYCKNTDCTNGFCGTLAAARTQGEHDFLTSLAGSGVRFWNAANSLAADTIWRWDGYGITVNFNLPWVTSADSNFNAHPSMVILDGRASPYAWDFASYNVSSNGFICRKDACSRYQDILGGICSGSAPSVQAKSSDENLAWISAPIIVGVVILCAVLLIFFVWKYHNGTYNRWKKSFFAANASSAKAMEERLAKETARVLELTEENQRLRAQLENLAGTGGGGEPATGGQGTLVAGARSIGKGRIGGGGVGGTSYSSTGLLGVPGSSINGDYNGSGGGSSGLPTVAGLPKIRRSMQGGGPGNTNNGQPSHLTPIESSVEDLDSNNNNNNNNSGPPANSSSSRPTSWTGSQGQGGGSGGAGAGAGGADFSTSGGQGPSLSRHASDGLARQLADQQQQQQLLQQQQQFQGAVPGGAPPLLTASGFAPSAAAIMFGTAASSSSGAQGSSVAGSPFAAPAPPNTQGPTVFQRPTIGSLSSGSLSGPGIFTSNRVGPSSTVFAPPRVIRSSLPQIPIPPSSSTAVAPAPASEFSNESNA